MRTRIMVTTLVLALVGLIASLPAVHVLARSAFSWQTPINDAGDILPTSLAARADWLALTPLIERPGQSVPLTDRIVARYDGATVFVEQAGEQAWASLVEPKVVGPACYLALTGSGSGVIVECPGTRYCFTSGDWQADCSEPVGDSTLHLPDGRWLVADQGVIYDAGWVETQGFTPETPQGQRWESVTIKSPDDRYPYRLSISDVYGLGLADHLSTGSSQANLAAASTAPIVVTYRGHAPVTIQANLSAAVVEPDAASRIDLPSGQPNSPAAAAPDASLIWNSPLAAGNILLPTTIAPAEAWLRLSQTAYGLGQAVPLGEHVIARYDGTQVSLEQEGQFTWDSLGTLEVGPDCSLSLAQGSGQLIAACPATTYCFDGAQWGTCAATPGQSILMLPDGRWLAADQGAVFDVGWAMAQGRIDQSVQWHAVSVDTPAAAYGYHLMAGNAQVGAVLNLDGQGPARFTLNGQGDLTLVYNGHAPAHIGVDWSPLSAAASGLPQVADQLDGVSITAYAVSTQLSAGQIYRSPSTDLPAGRKVAIVCAAWSGPDLNLFLTTPDSNDVLGYTTLTAAQVCNVVYGLVDRTYQVVIQPTAETLVDRLELHAQ